MSGTNHAGGASRASLAAASHLFVVLDALVEVLLPSEVGQLILQPGSPPLHLLQCCSQHPPLLCKLSKATLQRT